MGLCVAHIAYSQSEAQLIASSLKAAGIFVTVFDDVTSTMNPHLSVGLGGIRIMVAEEHLEDAQALIAGQVTTSSELESESDAFKRQKPKGIFGLFAFLFAGIWFPWWGKDRKWK